MEIDPKFVLTTEQLRRAVPSAFATEPLPGASSRYRFVPTSEVIELFRSEGWAPVRASEQRVRLEAKRGFQPHMVRFAHVSDFGKAFDLGDLRPELVLHNSHDRTTAFRIDAGLYRKICSNGLTVADTSFKGLSLRHVDLTNEAFLRSAAEVMAATPHTIAAVRRWKNIVLTEAARTEIATRAFTLRWDPEQIPAGLKAADLLKCRRREDASPDLWTTFNTVRRTWSRVSAFAMASPIAKPARSSVPRSILPSTQAFGQSRKSSPTTKPCPPHSLSSRVSSRRPLCRPAFLRAPPFFGSDSRTI